MPIDTTKQPARAGLRRKENPLLGNEKLRELYATMLKCRAIEQRARLLLQREQLALTPAVSPGCEATMVGCAIDLQPSDTLAASHRPLAADFLRGLPLDTVFSRLYGRSLEEASQPGRAQVTRKALKAAVELAGEQKQTGRVVVAVFTESRPSSRCNGIMKEASARSLPIVFVLDSGNRASALRSRNEKAREGLRFPVIPVDGADVVAVYRVAHECIVRARRGGGPALLECMTDNVGMRRNKPTSATELRSDPIGYMEQYLESRGLFTNEWRDTLVRDFDREMHAVIHAAECERFPRAIENAS